MDNLFNQKTIDAIDMFDDSFLNARALYLHAFNKLPDMANIYQIDGEKAFDLVKEKFSDRVVRIYQNRWYQSQTKKYQFSVAIILFDNGCLIELNTSWCDIYHEPARLDFVTALTELIGPLRTRQRRQPLEINMVVHDRHGLKLKGMEIKRTRLDIDLFYGEAFRETDEIIRKRLNKKNDKGIVLLHGLPGSGKTTYLRYLINKIKKRVLFLSPSVAGNLTNPDFIQLLIDNPNTVLIIEDAENIIMDRKHSHDSSVSTLLNISDGLLADFLNVQLICTFNSSLTLIDSALMRKGRLIAKHEFGKLSIVQAQRLSDHFGCKTIIDRPMTVAEIANQHEKQQESTRVEVIGFKRQTIEN